MFRPGNVVSKNGGASRRLVFAGYQVWIAAAVTWSLLVVVLACVLPVHTVNTHHGGAQPRHSILADFGVGVTLITCVPLVLSVLVGALLRSAAQVGGTWKKSLAWCLAILLVVASLVGFVTIVIGAFVIPAGAFLCAAVSIARVRDSGPEVTADGSPKPDL